MNRFSKLATHAILITQNLRNNTYTSLLIKSAVAVLLLYFLYADITRNNRANEIWVIFLNQMSGAEMVTLVIAVLLMPLNWLAESEKWRQIMHRHEYFPRLKAFRAVMTGVSFSLFTPNRVGEYGGRMLYVRPENQWLAVVANLMGNFCQFMVLTGIGAVGSMYILHRFELINRTAGQLLIAGAFLGALAMLWCYFNFPIVIDFIRRLKILQPFAPWFRRFNVGVIGAFNRGDLSGILLWAFIRFAIYSVQYFLLLRFFGINPGILAGFAGISALFLLQTSLPLPPVAGLVARGNMAVILWGQFGANEISALAATFTLWVINLAIPALIGTFSFFHVNISKSPDYEEEIHAIHFDPPRLGSPVHPKQH